PPVLSSTRFTDLVGCALPLQLAAMGGVGTTELAAAVAAAGGLGMVPFSETPASAACGSTFLMPFVPPLDVVCETAMVVRVAEFFYGDPDRRMVEAAHRGGALAGWQVGSAGGASARALLPHPSRELIPITSSACSRRAVKTPC